MMRVYRNTWMLTFLLFILCCRNQNMYNKDEHVKTYMIENSGLFVEIYRIDGFGVYGGDTEGIYVTDSSSFRKFVGTVYDNQKILFEMNGHHIKAKKIEPSINLNGRIIPEKLLEELSFDLEALKIQSDFE